MSTPAPPPLPPINSDAPQLADLFSPPTCDWFTGAFEAPTQAQRGAWQAIADGNHTVVVAPTGSGKTLAAFLWAIDQIASTPIPVDDPTQRCKVLYISPLKALAADVERNLRAPLRGIEQATIRAGKTPRDMTVGIRTGDTPAAERRRFATKPPDILITTPESLFLMLTSAARAGLRGIETVIIDEIHYVAGTKRGAHLAVSLERLDALLPHPARRIGLSATVEPVTAVADYLAGGRGPTEGGRSVRIVQPPTTKRFDISVEVPLDDITAPADSTLPQSALQGDASQNAQAKASVWPHVEERIVDLVADHTTTLVFTNARRGAERLTARMNEIWARRHGEEVPPPGELHAAHIQAQSGAAADVHHTIAKAHHGSMSRNERTKTETDLKNGSLPSVVATSSLELGIDMGSIDLVVQVGPPPSAASGLQRVGRAGHQVGAVSHGIIFPVHRGDLVPAALIAHRMRHGILEPLHQVTNPLDVLAQHIVAMLAVDDWTTQDMLALIRRAAPYTALGDASFTAVLDMLSGRYPSEDFGELRARIIWDRASGVLSARPGALRLAATSGGTIPDRGLYGVFLVDGASATESGQQPLEEVPGNSSERPGSVRLRGAKRVGELDEEMVYESRVGDVFTLGSSTWRIEEITPDRVLVSPAPGLPGRLPFWKGDSLGRPYSLGLAMGEWMRTGRHNPQDPAWLGLDDRAVSNLRQYLDDQEQATGTLPTDTTIVVERFRDELGDWRIVIHTPFGARVHAPWALVLGARLRERFGVDAATMHSDDGIVVRLPQLDDPYALPDESASQPAHAVGVSYEDLFIDPDIAFNIVREHVAESSLFGARFREAAGRALLLPRARPDRRQPLWQQRQRAAQLLSVASNYPDFPIVLEAVRECLQDDYDVPALRDIMKDIESGRIRVVDVTTQTASPFAQSLLFGYTAQFIYDSDAPLAERRAAALTLDPTLLAELLGASGSGDLADLLDDHAIETTAHELAGISGKRPLRHGEDLWDFLQRWGPASPQALAARWHHESHSTMDSSPLNSHIDAVTCDDSDPRLAEVHTALAELERSRRVMSVRMSGVSTYPLQWAAMTDAGRLRDALGVPLPPGIPDAYTEALPDPFADLVRRYAKTHVPFTDQDVANRYGVGRAVVRDVLRRLVSSGHLVTGRLLPERFGGIGEEYCDPEVLRMLRRRSLAALRAEVEPVAPASLATFLPSWHRMGQLRGVDGVAVAVEQLTGAPLPFSTIESDILPARVRGYRPTMMDELMVGGDILWVGHRPLAGLRGGRDGVISLHEAAHAHLTLPVRPPVHDHEEFGKSTLHRDIHDALLGSGGFFAHQLIGLLNVPTSDVANALWDLVWAGYVTNDSFAPLRALVGRTGAAPASRSTAAPRTRRSSSRFAGLSGAQRTTANIPDPTLVGRWSSVPQPSARPEEHLAAWTAVLLDRHGVITRSVLDTEDLDYRFADLYRALSTMESGGQVRRGYFIEHLGGSQFAAPGAVEALRASDSVRATSVDRHLSEPLVLSAVDPANPYGAALSWPDTPQGVRLARRAGAHVVTINGELVFFIDRGGRALITCTTNSTLFPAAARATIRAVDDGRMTGLTLQRINGEEAVPYLHSTTGEALLASLTDVGFSSTPSGVRYRGTRRNNA